MVESVPHIPEYVCALKASVLVLTANKNANWEESNGIEKKKRKKKKTELKKVTIERLTMFGDIKSTNGSICGVRLSTSFCTFASNIFATAPKLSQSTWYKYWIFYIVLSLCVYGWVDIAILRPSPFTFLQNQIKTSIANTIRNLLLRIDRFAEYNSAANVARLRTHVHDAISQVFLTA